MTGILIRRENADIYTGRYIQDICIGRKAFDNRGKD
jgi:hypothetical protein